MTVQEITNLKKIYLDKKGEFFEPLSLELFNFFKKHDNFYVKNLEDPCNLISLYENLKDDEDSLNLVLDTFGNNKNKILTTVDYSKEKINLYKTLSKEGQEEIKKNLFVFKGGKKNNNNFPVTIKSVVDYILLERNDEETKIVTNKEIYYYMLEPCTPLTYYTLLELSVLDSPNDVFIYGVISPEILKYQKENSEEYEHITNMLDGYALTSYFYPKLHNEIILPNPSNKGIWHSYTDIADESRKEKLIKMIESQSKL